jgi:uncharacterized protein YidB (DUF937 family)
MSGLDDLIGSLQKAQTGGGGGLDDVLGSVLGGSGTSSGSGGSGGGLGDILGSVLGGGGGGGLGDVLGSVLGGGSGSSTKSGGGAGSLMATLGPMLAMLLANGGLQKILGSLRANGLTSQADSWVSTGENQAIDPEQIKQALDADQIGQIADHLGIDADQASQVLAEVLPGLVNTVTPDGKEPSNDELDRLADALKGFKTG